MAYYSGTFRDNSASLGGRYGSIRIETSPNDSSAVIVSGRYGKRYPVYLRQTNSGLMGERIFPRTAVKVVWNSDTNKCSVWIKSLGSRRKNYRRSSAPSYGRRTYNRYGAGGNGRMYGPAF